ncbi:alpha-ribazole phosphatase [Thermithiobacillus plumbiphilus]|uniref:Alpha-ribazole phosphatase n=1 Tax=Thermithiobacillus plumbiphilus TaxID=1729899 RepID=A0ABU9D6N6_9PROT
MNLYLLRHTRTVIEASICHGQTDIGLPPDFAHDLATIRAKLPDLSGMTIYASPLQRCRLLAEALAPGRVHCDARLMELNFGEWEGQPWDAIDRVALDHWAADFVHRAPPGGESFAQLQARCLDFLVALPEDQDVLLVTHAGVIRAVLAHARSLPLDRAFEIPVGHGEISSICWSYQHSNQNSTEKDQ